MISKEYTWNDVVKKCEQILGCEDTADSPLQSNLPNLVRDLKSGASPQSTVLTNAIHSDGEEPGQFNIRLKTSELLKWKPTSKF